MRDLQKLIRICLRLRQKRAHGKSGCNSRSEYMRTNSDLIVKNGQFVVSSGNE